MIKALSWRFRKYIRRFHMLTVKGCSETRLLGEWSNQAFHSLQFRKYITYDDQFFFENVQNFM